MLIRFGRYGVSCGLVRYFILEAVNHARNSAFGRRRFLLKVTVNKIWSKCSHFFLEFFLFEKNFTKSLKERKVRLERLTRAYQSK